MHFEKTANAVIERLGISNPAHQRATAITSRLAAHYARQPFLWALSCREQMVFPLYAGLPPRWGGLHMKYLFLISPESSGFTVKEVERDEAESLLFEPPALPRDNKKQLVSDVTFVLSQTCWGVIQDPPLEKDNPAYWIGWVDYFKTSNNPVMEQYMTDAIVKLSA